MKDYQQLFEPQRSSFAIFHDLMPSRVKEILLLATVYDAYILEKEGQLFEQIYGEYYQYNISSAPRVHPVYSLDDAASLLETREFDLVIIVTGTNKHIPLEAAHAIKQRQPELPVILLVNDNNLISEYDDLGAYKDDIDKIFVWNGDSNIFLAIIKFVEDRKNAQNDTALADVRVILLVEDSVRYYSRYLPRLYAVVMREVQRLIGGEDIDARYKLLKMRARPKILLVSTYEEALEFYELYREYLLCVITDVQYPCFGQMHAKAGFKLVDFIRNNSPVPILMQSSDEECRRYARKEHLGFIDKKSPDLSRELVEFFKKHLGFGNFIFRSKDGRVLAEARYMKEFEVLMDSIPEESIEYHGKRNHFSTWFMAKGEIRIALKLKKISLSDFQSISDARRFIRKVIRERWTEKKRDSIANFSEASLQEDFFLMRISKGSVGGKGRGIAFTESLLQKEKFKSIFDDIQVNIPKTVVVGTDEYEYFIEQFDYPMLCRATDNYEALRKAFARTPLSSVLRQRLKVLLRHLRGPLAVRSSSLFEDSFSQPFAGVYETYFLANTSEDIDVRCQELELAVKMVFASLFSPESQSYFGHVSHSLEEEKMAVLIQELSGSQHGRYFYPNISGVAQSWNYYPFDKMKPEDGIALLAVGMGKSVVDGEASFRVCPRHPAMKLLTIRDLLNNSQRFFYAMDLHKSENNLQGTKNIGLERLPVEVAEKHGTLQLCASVYDAQSEMLRPGLHFPGPRVLDFSYILQYRQVPLAETLVKILDIMEKAFGSPVEIEFSLDFTGENGQEPIFHILQVKPLIRRMDNINIQIEELDRSQLILYTDRSMGNGILEDITDIVYVVPERFSKMKTRDIARELAEINGKLKKAERQYILAGPGRWGSSDPYLGIPVDWSTISEARVIIEAGLRDFSVDASLGSHFFHNITSMNVGYFTVPYYNKKAFLDHPFLSEQPAETETQYLRHIRFPRAIKIIMDGRKSQAFILKPR